MDSQMFNLVERLISIQIELGPVTYHRAVGAACQAVARVALAEAESQAGVVRPAPAPGTVVKFPLGARLDGARGGDRG